MAHHEQDFQPDLECSSRPTGRGVGTCAARGKIGNCGRARTARDEVACQGGGLLLIAALASGSAISLPASAQVVIPAGTDIGAYLNTNLSAVNNNFVLSGNANGNTYVAQTAPHSLLTLDGAGNTIGSIGGPILGPITEVTPTTATISNVTFRGTPTDVWPVFCYNTNGVTSNVNLNDVTFPVLSVVRAAGDRCAGARCLQPAFR